MILRKMSENKTIPQVQFEPVVGYNAWCDMDDSIEKTEHIASFVYYPDEPKEPLIEFLRDHGLESVDAVVSAILGQGLLDRHVRITYDKVFKYYSMQKVN